MSLRRPPARAGAPSVLACVRRSRVGGCGELAGEVSILAVVAGVVAWQVPWGRVGPAPVPATQLGYAGVLATAAPLWWLLATERGWRLLRRVARRRHWCERWRHALEVASHGKLPSG